MKKLLLLISLLFILFEVHAQTSIKLGMGTAFDSLDDYRNFRCSKNMRFLFRAYGWAQGYNPSTDSVQIKIQFGDGLDTLFKTNIYSNLYFYKDGDFIHHYANIGFVNLKMVAIGPDGPKDSIEQNNMLIGTTCDSISGKLYADNNANCMFDTGEPIINAKPRILCNNIEILNWSSLMYGYKYFLPVDFQYDLILPNNVNGAFCPTTRHVSALPASNQDFGFQCASGIDMTGIMFWPEFIPWSPNVRYMGIAGNFGCSTVSSGKIKLVFDTTFLTPVSFPNPYTISGDTIIWSFTNMGCYYNSPQTFLPYINFNLVTLPQINDTICFTQIETPVAGDINPANNIQHQCWPFHNSWDPNDKQVSPVGDGPNGNITNNQNMTYKIRFQNTGNAYAHDIYIIDTLDSDLEIGTFSILKSSFSYTTATFIGPNVVKFNLPNIYLPDSGTNQSGSNGYIIYSIKQKPNLSVGTTLKNTAYIYFDNNPAVKTNTTLNTIYEVITDLDKKEGIENISIFPNPAFDELTITGCPKTTIAKIYDISGKLLLTKQLSTNEIKVSDLAKGLYFIKLTSEEGSVVRKFVKE